MPFRPEPFLAIFCQFWAKNGQNRLLASIGPVFGPIEAKAGLGQGQSALWPWPSLALAKASFGHGNVGWVPAGEGPY